MSLKSDMITAAATAETKLSEAATALNVIKNGIVQTRASQRSSDVDNALALDRVAIAVSRRMRGLGLHWLLDNVETSPASAGSNWGDEIVAAINRFVP